MKGYNDYKYTMTKGDTLKMRFTVVDRTTRVPQDITAWTAFRCTAKQLVTEPDNVAVFTKTLGSGITKVTPAGGLIEVVVSPSDTSSLEWRDYSLFVDVQGVDGSGDTWTISKVMLEVQPDVSRTNP